MKNHTFKIKPLSMALLLAGMGVASVSHAAVDLVAVEGVWSPDGGTTQIPMWGFAPDPNPLDPCPAAPVTWSAGPQLTDADLVAGNLTVNLRNCLSEPVSIVIPGQPANLTPQTIAHIDTAGRNSTRIRAFTHEAPAGGTASYTWTGVKPGTYLYQSGSHPAKQVHMGLFGALTVGSYPGTSGDVTLIYSEVDPVLHNAEAAATPLGYRPRHFLVSQSGTVGDTNQPTVIRMLNAGLDFHVPTLSDGHMSLVAEDGNMYPFARQQYSVTLPAGKTTDALWSPSSAGDYFIYDRRGHGMVASLTVTAGVGQPIANGDLYNVTEDMVLNVPAIGVLGNDTDALGVSLSVPLASAVLVSSTSSGSLVFNADGSFSYTPEPDFSGTDSFTYKANDGTLDSNAANVDITVTPVNDTPVANPGGPYTATVNVPVVLDGSGSSDIDGDALTYSWDFDTAGPGVYTGVGVSPSHTYTTTGTYTVSLTVNDGTEDSLAATTTVEVIDAVNTAPVAVEDGFEVLRNSTANNLNLITNDSDVDGNFKDAFGNVPAAQINITTGTTTSRGGTVNVITNGVNYVPKRNFRGTDTFNYTVTDLDGAVSNEVKVRVNVVRP